MYRKIREYSKENKDFKIINSHGSYLVKGDWTIVRCDEEIIHFKEMSPRALDTSSILAVVEVE